VAAAITVIVAVLSGSDGTPRQASGLDGTYSVEFGAATTPDGAADQNVTAGRETWVIKSACPANGCVATASRIDGSQSAGSTMVLDQIGGRWSSVTATQGSCQNAPTEYWEMLTLQPLADGKLQGEFVVRSAAGCSHNQQVTFTRTGDSQGNVSVADPSSQPPRVKSAAEGLHGKYHEIDTYTNGGRTAEADFDIQTYCLRTGDRCLSYWKNPGDAKILVFAQNQWVLATPSQDAKCNNGSPAHGQITLQYPLPQSAQDPITMLTGRGHYTVTGQCPFDSDFDSRVQRTGD
jgi:hypothetical protein